jgi:carbon-monoxide dehydrogenase medium subunit
MALPTLTHATAHSLGEAVEAVADGAVPYGGGTELLPAMRLGLLKPERIVDIKPVAKLQGIRVDEDSVTVGATVRHAEVARHPEIRTLLPMLAAATARIGNPRVRWQGTVGGNLAFAEPRSDLIPVMIALGANIHLASPTGARQAPLEDLIDGPYAFGRAEDEIIVNVELPHSGITFQRYERIALMERPSAGVALVAREGMWRLVVGAAGFVPVIKDADDLDAFGAKEVADELEPIQDATGSAGYKRFLVANLVVGVLSSARRDSR